MTSSSSSTTTMTSTMSAPSFAPNTSSSTTSTTPTLTFVMENNRGIIHLRNGDIGPARKCFTDALRSAQMGLILNDSNVVVEPQQQQEGTAATAAGTAASTTTNTNNIREELFARLQKLPTGDLREQALSIFMDPSQLSCANMALIYAVIIYNMGLVYHVRGRDHANNNNNNNRNNNNSNHNFASCVSSTSSSSAHQQQQHQNHPYHPTAALYKACDLYQKALGIVMVELGEQQMMCNGAAVSSRNPIIDLLRMSLLKHLADIYTTLSEFELARTFGNELVNFITSVGCFQYRDVRVTELMQVQVGCFLMYAHSLHQGSLLAPAA